MCARRRTHFLCPAKESKQRKAAPRQRPCTSLRFAPLRSGQTCEGASLCAAWVRAANTAVWDGLQGAQPQQGCGLARMRQPQERPKRFFAAAHGRGQAHHGGAAEHALRSAIAPPGQRPRVRSRCHCMLRCICPPPSSPSQALPQGVGESGHRCARPRAGFALLALAFKYVSFALHGETVGVRGPHTVCRMRGAAGSVQAAGVQGWEYGQRAACGVRRAQKMANKNSRLRRSLLRVCYLF